MIFEHEPDLIILPSFNPRQEWIHTFHGCLRQPVSISAGASGRQKDTLSFFPFALPLLAVRPERRHVWLKEAASAGWAVHPGFRLPASGAGAREDR